MGMSAVPLSELYAGAERFLRERGGEVCFNAGVEARSGTRKPRGGR